MTNKSEALEEQLKWQTFLDDVEVAGGGLGAGLMAGVGRRPPDPYDKVMKERRMAGVQPGRARGPPCLTNTLGAR